MSLNPVHTVFMTGVKRNFEECPARNGSGAELCGFGISALRLRLSLLRYRSRGVPTVNFKLIQSPSLILCRSVEISVLDFRVRSRRQVAAIRHSRQNFYVNSDPHIIRTVIVAERHPSSVRRSRPDGARNLRFFVPLTVRNKRCTFDYIFRGTSRQHV
jgi:hypothetical protein